ncbi:MAG: molybdate ABC transporter substrate-binding protein [Myxococcota bacterium]
MRWSVAVVLLCAGCGASSPREPVHVFAASSLTAPFEDLEARFERAHPQVDVRLTFAGSQVLRLQVEQGAPADVFASADLVHARALHEAGLLEAPQVFATTELTVVVPRDDDAISEIADLASARRIVAGASSVPIGAYTQQMLGRARTVLGDGFVQAVEAAVVSEESNVRLVRTKVELGEADAAVVYATEVNDRVRAIPVPDAMNVTVELAAGISTRAERSSHAAAFMGALCGPMGAAALRTAGFEVVTP